MDKEKIKHFVRKYLDKRKKEITENKNKKYSDTLTTGTYVKTANYARELDWLMGGKDYSYPASMRSAAPIFLQAGRMPAASAIGAAYNLYNISRMTREIRKNKLHMPVVPIGAGYGKKKVALPKEIRKK